jgi:His-Xaa-Ser system protein HxsD
MNAPPFSRREEGVVNVRVDLRAYRLTAIKKSAYRIAEKCTILLGEINGNEVQLTFLFKRPASDAAQDELTRLFFQDLLDQELREHVAEETEPMRNLILAHAFSRTDLIEREQG